MLFWKHLTIIFWRKTTVEKRNTKTFFCRKNNNSLRKKHRTGKALFGHAPEFRCRRKNLCLVVQNTKQ
jgi:hypothetical protein